MQQILFFIYIKNKTGKALFPMHINSMSIQSYHFKAFCHSIKIFPLQLTYFKLRKKNPTGLLNM